MLKKCWSWLDKNLEESILLALLGAMSIIMMIQILMRYFLQSPMSWAEEFCRYCFVYSGTLSAGYCLRKGVGIRVDLVLNILPGFLKVLVEYAGRLLTLALYAYMFYSSFALLQSTTTVSPAMQIPMKYIYMAFPIGFGLGALRSIQDIALYTISLVRKKTPAAALEGGSAKC